MHGEHVVLLRWDKPEHVLKLLTLYPRRTQYGARPDCGSGARGFECLLLDQIDLVAKRQGNGLQLHERRFDSD
jgi:hypothetical protein